MAALRLEVQALRARLEPAQPTAAPAALARAYRADPAAFVGDCFA